MTSTRWWGLAGLGVAAAVAVVGPSLLGSASPNVDRILEGPSWDHFLGTDELGRDALARTLVGLRVSLGFAVLATFGTAVFGIALGLLAAFGGGWLDAGIQRASEVVLAIPKLPLLLVFAAVAVPSTAATAGFGGQVGRLVLAFVLLSWVTMARVVRADGLRLRRAPFVEAARAAGLPPGTVAVRHVLPHMLPAIGVTMALDFGDIVLMETGLSFLGLGIQPPTPSLGGLLSRGLEYILGSPWLLWAPGLLTVVVVASAHLLAEASPAVDHGSVAEAQRAR